MQPTTQAVGIDLGTTYSCIAYLNESGEPITLANDEGELSTPSAVMFDGDKAVVGTKALENAIARPEEVIVNSKRHIGTDKHWMLAGRKFNPVDVGALVLKKLIGSAQRQIGQIEQAVVTVPAQFSDAQRHATIQAGMKAGLKRVDIINEPVAAALCYVLGTLGIWFKELAKAQNILVYDLGGGTFDLSLVRYEQHEVSVVKGSGDLHLGGVDWSQALVDAIAKQFTTEFGRDPRHNPQSLQALVNESEKAKRALTTRPKAALTCEHGDNRKTYQILREQFQQVSRPLLERTIQITHDMLKDGSGKVRWSQVDVVLTTGGSSRMPQIRDTLKELSGTTINTSLSPDQSIAHGAAYYAGMLLTDQKFAKSILTQEAKERLGKVKQRSVNARSLGVMVYDRKARKRFPHYMLPPNTSLPAEVKHTYGTVRDDQRRVHLRVVESGYAKAQPPSEIGTCVIEDLPAGLPAGSLIDVILSYDSQARIQVKAIDRVSGTHATAEIVRQENIKQQLEQAGEGADILMVEETAGLAPVSEEAVKSPPKKKPPAKPAPRPQPKPAARKTGKPSVRAVPRAKLDGADKPVPLCNECGEPLTAVGECPRCSVKKKKAQPAAAKKRTTPASPPPIDDDEILDLTDQAVAQAQPKPARKVVKKVVKKAAAEPQKEKDDDFFYPLD